jgi:hypothetical protein
MSQAPPPPPPGASAPLEPPEGSTAGVRWNGWDIVLVFLIGLGIGVPAIVAILLSIRAFEFDVSQTSQVGLASVVIYLAVFLAGWLLVIKRREATAEGVGFKWVGAGPVLLSIPVLLGLMVLTALILVGMDALIGGVPTAQEQVAPDESSLQGSDLVWLLLAGSVAAPVTEEFFFRGLLYRYLRARSGVWVGALVSSALFALFHVVPALMPALFVFGLVQVWLVQRYDSLYPAILLHALNNGVLLVAVYAELS